MKKRVLIIEDDADARLMFVKQLQHQYFLVFAASPKEAVELFNDTAPDFVGVDACVGSRLPNTISLVKFMRQTFHGPMIGISGSKAHNKLLLYAGCSHACKKANFAQTIKTLDEASSDPDASDRC